MGLAGPLSPMHPGWPGSLSVATYFPAVQYSPLPPGALALCALGVRPPTLPLQGQLSLTHQASGPSQGWEEEGSNG